MQARNASVVLFGDNPSLTGEPVRCKSNHDLCSLNAEADTRRRANDALILDFAAGRPNVFGFIQSDLWTPPSGESFWGNVPGTTTNAYYDSQHLLIAGAKYLSPYICTAFSEWGLFQ